jgi:hypothetical protein
VQETKVRSLTLRIAAGVFVLFGAFTVPIMFIFEKGWRKSAIIPVIYICWKFANYALKRETPPKEGEQ